MLNLFVLSDGTAKTAERLARSALMQFAGAPVKLVLKPRIRTAEQVRAVVLEAASQTAVILHTLVSTELRRLMYQEAHQHGVDVLDVLGPLLDRLATRLQTPPQEVPGLLEQLMEVKTRQIEAVNYSFRHDDGQNPDDLHHAEIVLAGASRTMKTPTMLYLAYRGWFAANVPLVEGLPVPESLSALPADRVFCLFMSPSRLLELRLSRSRGEGIPEEFYATRDQIHKELRFAEHVCNQYQWRRIDVTTKSAEEVGQEIIALMPPRHGD